MRFLIFCDIIIDISMNFSFRSTIRFFAVILFFLISSFALADEFTSSSFKVLDPVIAPGGAGYSESSGFKLWCRMAVIALGVSESL